MSHLSADCASELLTLDHDEHEESSSSVSSSPCLSSHTMEALGQFLGERASEECALQELRIAANSITNPDPVEFNEDWQLSQFWYDEKTCAILCDVIMQVVGLNGRVAFVSAPTLFRHMRRKCPNSMQLTLFEFDRRFAVFGEQFVFYDYRQPVTSLPDIWQHSCDLVVADPPFLSDECLKKTSDTLLWLSRQHIILCTGRTMADLAGDLLNLKLCQFQPRHVNNLANGFCCLASFDLDLHVRNCSSSTSILS